VFAIVKQRKSHKRDEKKLLSNWFREKAITVKVASKEIETVSEMILKNIR
jgi:hypothetical protein